MDLIELWFKMKQIKQGIFVHQAKYTKDLMKMFNMVELKPVSTPMNSTTLLGPDEDGEAMDQRVQEHDRLPPVPHSDTTDILLLHRWILLAFSMLILRIVGLTERAPLRLVIFLDLLSFASLLENSLQLYSPPPMLSM
jgi:hypothetical protein